MNWKEQYKSLLWLLAGFLFAYFMPISNTTFRNAILEGFILLKWYAQEHVLLCLVPAFFIAGIISVFINQNAVIKYLGFKAKKWIAYSVSSISGTILAVCSCTVLPLFAGIYKRGAGLGPAITFLYSGPAINILAIILTMRILGIELGIARMVGAIIFSIIIGLIMSYIYRKEEEKKSEKQFNIQNVQESKPLWQTAFHFFLFVAILIFANWGKPNMESGFWFFIYSNKWLITGIFGLLLIPLFIFILKLNKILVIASAIFVIAIAIIFKEQPTIPFTSAVIFMIVTLSLSKGEPNEWLGNTFDYAKQILPLLAVGILIAGFLLGSPDNNDNGIIPKEWIYTLVGGNSLFSNFFASIAGAFMYFATLTEIPILQGLINNGMGKGPALALLLAGPALSLPNMFVIKSVIGFQKAIIYVTLVIIMATITGLIYGYIF